MIDQGIDDVGIVVGRTWNMWACRDDQDRSLWFVSRDRRAVAMCHSSMPIVPVLIEEILADEAHRSVTHYGWEYLRDRHFKPGEPHMIQVRAGDKTTALLSICFAHDMRDSVKDGSGRVLPLRVTEVTVPVVGQDGWAHA
jgi:hypothetical protein